MEFETALEDIYKITKSKLVENTEESFDPNAVYVSISCPEGSKFPHEINPYIRIMENLIVDRAIIKSVGVSTEASLTVARKDQSGAYRVTMVSASLAEEFAGKLLSELVSH